MRTAALLALAVALMAFVGCTCASDRLRETAAEINATAFDGKVATEICYCNRHADPGCWKHQGVYLAGGGSVSAVIHLAPEWYWEPKLYFRGAVAHELIHAYLDQTGQEASQRHPHSWIFRQERERVAKALDLPVWAIPDGKKETKLDATRTMAYLERSLEATRNQIHGVIHESPSSIGWPTQLYDPD